MGFDLRQDSLISVDDAQGLFPAFHTDLLEPTSWDAPHTSASQDTRAESKATKRNRSTPGGLQYRKNTDSNPFQQPQPTTILRQRTERSQTQLYLPHRPHKPSIPHLRQSSHKPTQL
eukprot:GEZU01029351.1.p2 GENE.GEZU01029351.1~~GEZU01029351.1.p2  ORF type:complete len:117 (+),score=6.76 GEZU01029351.1:451-801(+)